MFARRQARLAAGTTMLLNEGRKAIEDIVVGDYVWAWDEETGEKSLRRVTETYVNQTSELVYVFVGGEEIITTPTHPFYSPVKGWTDACQLRAGDILVLVNGEYVVVEKVQHEILESPINVYNFQVAGDHTYYVSDIGVLVHNGCTQGHHVISPKNSTYTPKFKKITDRFGLDLNDGWNIIDLPDHIGRHTNKYHEFILESITDIANNSANANDFLRGFQKIVDALWSNPRIPYM